MDLSQLEGFRRAARFQNLTRAAASLGIAQPSLSRSIRLLEEELGVALFDRQGRGLRLNAAGQAFLEPVEAAFRALEDGRRALADLDARREATLSVAAVAPFWTTDLFRAFAARHPDVRLRLYGRTPAEMRRGLARRELDLALLPDPKDAALGWTPLATGDVWAMVPPGHRLAARGEAPWAELGGEPTILSREGGPLRELVEAAFREAGLELDVACESDDVFAMDRLVEAGLGVQFLPDFRRELASGSDPRYVRLVEPARSIELGLAWPREGYRTRASHDFAAFALAFLRA